MKMLAKAYLKLFDDLNGDNLRRNEYSDWQAHTLLIVMLSTGLLMWAYALLAYLHINHPAPFTVGIIASLFHLFSPYILRQTKSVTLATNVLIGSGMIHQGTFSFYSDGFMSPILIWFGILPMLGGVINGKKGAATWATTTVLVAGTMFFLSQNGLTPPSYLSPEGKVIAQGMLVFGWIFLSTIIIHTFILFRNASEQNILEKHKQVESLIRILCHDITNPLLNIRLRFSVLQKLMKEKDELQLDQIESSLDRMVEIVEQIKSWQSIKDGKRTIKFKLLKLQKLIPELLDQFRVKIEEKGLSIHMDDSTEEIEVLTDEGILFNHVLCNLFSNALKFAPKNSQIDLTIREHKDAAEISIADHGKGIPSQLMDKLFKVDEKTTCLGTDGEAGTGFGLPIVKTSIESIDAKIKVDSSTDENNSYTKFTVLLPLGKPL